jgi:hypothetical protein
VTNRDPLKECPDRLQPVLEHLSMVAYVERVPVSPVDLVERCSVIARELFGSRKLYLRGAVLKEAGHGVEDHRQSLRLGQAIMMDVEPSRIDALVAYGPAPRARRFKGIYETLWDLTFEREQVWVGLKHGPVLRLGINLEQISPELLPRLTQVAIDFSALVAGFNSFTYGLCDVGDYRDTVLGMMYGGAWHASANFRSQLRRMVWTRAGDDRIHQARDVFWGNILGTQILKKLGGTAWLERYKKVSPAEEQLVHPFAHGTLILISGHVKHVRYGPASPSLPTLERASYLYKELAKARLLCGMQG